MFRVLFHHMDIIGGLISLFEPNFISQDTLWNE